MIQTLRVQVLSRLHLFLTLDLLTRLTLLHRIDQTDFPTLSHWLQILHRFRQKLRQLCFVSQVPLAMLPLLSNNKNNTTGNRAVEDEENTEEEKEQEENEEEEEDTEVEEEEEVEGEKEKEEEEDKEEEDEDEDEEEEEEEDDD